MALYNVERTDDFDVKPGEFVSAFVIAHGVNQARAVVAHLDGVAPKGKNLRAEKVEVRKGYAPATLVSVYWDERDPDNSFLPGQMTFSDADPDAEADFLS